MSNLILKISNGELFDFFDSETKKEFVVGSKRTCDVTVKSFIVAPVQLRFLQKNNVWYIEDLTPEGYKSEVLVGGKRFRKPVIRFDGDVVIRKTGEKHGDCVKISQVKKISGKRGGSNFDLTQRTLTVVGRDPSCDIVVDNPMVNEKHFRIVYDGEDYYIEDLHSTGGTFVNNRKIRRAKLGDYDRISVPSAAYTFFERRLLFSTSPAGIQIDAVGVTKEVTDRRSHGKAKLVGEVSFRIEAGAFVAIVGGSGTGKSTLLDCLNGIRPATGGGIYYDTNDYYDNINSYKNVMGYVPQRDIMHDDLTVEDGLYYTAMLRIRTPMSRREVKERVKEAIADVRLTGREKLKISSLSGGQRKRVSIAMELLSDPKIIFLDEPTSGLSPDLDLEMMDLLKELAGKGRTIVVITHAMENLGLPLFQPQELLPHIRRPRRRDAVLLLREQIPRDGILQGTLRHLLRPLPRGEKEHAPARGRQEDAERNGAGNRRCGRKSEAWICGTRRGEKGGKKGEEGAGRDRCRT